jgi:Bacteriophage Sf6, terminase small subunit-like
MGNKTKYSKAVVDRICRYIASGLNYKQAAQAALIGERTLLEWRRKYPDFADKVEAAREIMRSKVLAKIKAAGAKDWRAHVEFLRLAFAEYRFGNSQQVNVAIKQNMAVSDPERTKLIDELEKARARALSHKSVADRANEELQLRDKQLNAREISLEAERKLAEGQSAEAHDPEPESLREKPPKTVVERADWRDECKRPTTSRRDEVDEILDY